MTNEINDTAAIRQRNLRSVFTLLLDSNSLYSRATLASTTGLSKPTIGNVLGKLAASGLVRESGRTVGHRGPSAVLYQLVNEAVLLLGVGVGARVVRAILADIRGNPVRRLSMTVREPHADAMLQAVSQIGAQLGDLMPRVEAVVVGSPGVVNPSTGRVTGGSILEGLKGRMATRAFSVALGCEHVWVENDVNLAAIGEQAAGLGRGMQDFVYLEVDEGIGAGIVIGGELYRGSGGTAGELGFLPVGPDPFKTGLARGGAMSAMLSIRAIVRETADLAREHGVDFSVDDGVEGVLSIAKTQTKLGQELAGRLAQRFAILIASAASVLNMRRVVLGGDLGSNVQFLLPEVSDLVTQLVDDPPEIVLSQLGSMAVASGGVRVARDHAIGMVVDRLG